MGEKEDLKTSKASEYLYSFINMENKKEIKEAVYKSYGAVMLKNGVSIQIKFNFFVLKEIWKLWREAQLYNDKERISEILNETQGGIFNCGDIVVCIDDILVLYDIQAYEMSTDQELKEIRKKSNIIDNYFEENF